MGNVVGGYRFLQCRNLSWLLSEEVSLEVRNEKLTLNTLFRLPYPLLQPASLIFKSLIHINVEGTFQSR